MAAGRRYLSPLLSEAFIRRYLKKFQSALLKLSDAMIPREQKVLQMVLDGASSCEIGARLKISLRSVEANLASFVVKLGLNADCDIIDYAVKRRVSSRRRANIGNN